MKLEDLSNEVIYEIFEYLDYLQSYEIFSNFNQRFQHLFTSSMLPIKIQFPSMCQCTFESSYREIIISHQHRIRSVYLPNPFLSEFFVSFISLIPKLIHLETFIIRDIPSDYLKTLLNHLSVVPNLSSLVINSKFYVSERNHLYEQIFRLSSLTYCQLSIHECYNQECLPIRTNQFSRLTHLVIRDKFNISELPSVLSYVPQLHRLSINKLSTWMNIPSSISSKVVNQLKYVSLNLGEVYFDEFLPVIKSVFYQVEVLYLSTPADKTYLMANRWESLIPLYMPYLKIFDLQQHVYTSKTDGEDYIRLMDQFESSFWFERQWFFAFHMRVFGENAEIEFYSIDPYRKKEFKLEFELRKRTTPLIYQRPMSSVDHLQLQDENCFVNWTTYFPNVTQLSLNYNYFLEEQKYISPILLNRFLSLKQITQLNTYISYAHIEDLFQLIISLPNLQKLCLNRMNFDPTGMNSHGPNEISHLISMINEIKQITITIQ